STAPTLDWVCLWERGVLSPVSQASTLFKDVGDQLWELSSFSEAAMADYQATSLSADRASSQPR
ncbi:hypothetical protein, partial [Pseudomonas sp. IPO3778]|uniref:hypothetical protein n=1 Tax=Pseudomonas sp. IPO3778 TaxID=2726976 RepID=UPI001C4C5FB1